MSDGFTAGGAYSAFSIFSCPNCNETIDVSADSCRFCGIPVDHEAAQKAAELLAKVNQACSDASYMKSTAFALPVFFVVRFVPFISMVGVIGFIGLLFAIPVWALIWWARNGSLTSTDKEFRGARKTVRNIGIVVTSLLALFLLIEALSVLIRMRT